LAVIRLVAGLLETIFGYLRLGKVADLVTEPVIAGFLNAFALFLIKSQVSRRSMCKPSLPWTLGIMVACFS
jgi:MFS superfamily sulfate permease-like transporter